ncbi:MULTISPECIES: hypothetical protein [Chromobacterium]|uniref:hypothetical protein n=1 Tax=Chromobacterium TaxID=535 RepID=UPI001887E9B8|nr:MULTISPECIES: hypothetical protein [Chromobacterium]WON83117.1 hypothetical protein OK026_18525 [Chromobacterium haemolyticum]
MADKRPAELVIYIEAAAEKNDALIIAALTKLEATKSINKLKPTVSSICNLTGLSRNTIRNRPWALERLKAIKQKHKSAIADKKESDAGTDSLDETSILDTLRKRVKCTLEQNALLYEEVLSLQQIIEKKDAEIKFLKHQKR